MSLDSNLYEKSIKILTDLISFKTISGKDNGPLIDYCDDILKKNGVSTFRVFDEKKERVNLFGTIKAKKINGKKPIILSGHTDVVPVSKGWTTDPFIATVKGDKLFGRGSCDMKGFIACVLAYVPKLSKTNLDRDIHFSFTFDEETACIGAPLLIKELKKRNIRDGICIIGEPTKMKIIDAHKGMNEYTIHFEGLAGHSSQPHKGVNAIEYATRYINKLLELREELINRAPKDCIFDPPHSTLSVGGILGGIAHNVIADKCKVEWETRPVVKEDGTFVTEQIDNFVNELPKKENTIIGHDGIFLSGGQKQRIVIARAILLKPKLLILDEATNALDKTTENEIINDISKIKKNMSIILITHDSALIKKCDIVFKIRNKKISIN